VGFVPGLWWSARGRWFCSTQEVKELKGKKTGGRNFLPGNKAAAGVGKRWLDPEVKRIKRFTAAELEELITVLLYANDADVKLILNDPLASKIKKIVARALHKADEAGSWSILDSILSRVIGKVKEVVEHQGLKPSILVKTDGSEVEFGLQKVKDEEE
jgi:hypothetical protein